MIDALLPTYARAPLTFVKGQGSWLTEADGRRYLDLGAGIGVNALGHGHPALVAALTEQAATLWHTSNLYQIPQQAALAARLVDETFADTVFFTNSGTEACELAIKMTRRYWHDLGETDRVEIITFEGAFHGRSAAGIAATGSEKMTHGFAPLLPGFVQLPFGDHDALSAAITNKTAAILIEPIQGEGGIRAVPDQCLKGLRDICDEHGLLLIFDEVQCGRGRTGPLFAYQHDSVTPDVMTLAKALGNGIPIGAMCATERHAAALTPGTHGSTFGGNPLAAACATAVLDELIEGGVLDRAREVGEYLGTKLAAIASRCPEQVVEARGRGHLRALELREPVADLIDRCREEGVLVIQAGANILRFAPPLIVTREMIDEGLAVIERQIKS